MKTWGLRACCAVAARIDELLGVEKDRLGGGRSRCRSQAGHGQEARCRGALTEDEWLELIEGQCRLRGSSEEPSPLVNVEFHQTFAAHFQKQRLAGFLIHDIGAFHDLMDLERLFAERIQDILAIIQHDYSPQTRKTLAFTLE
jgi:hypothetical protein